MSNHGVEDVEAWVLLDLLNFSSARERLIVSILMVMKQIKILQLILRFKIFRINKVNLNYCYMLELTERKQTRNRQHPDIQNLTANKIKTLSCYFKVSAQMTIIR